MDQLIEKRKSIESKIDELLKKLSQANVKRNEPLKTADGYPRGDIDVYEITHIKSELVRLENDFKTVQKELEEAVKSAFSRNKST